MKPFVVLYVMHSYGHYFSALNSFHSSIIWCHQCRMFFFVILGHLFKYDNFLFYYSCIFYLVKVFSFFVQVRGMIPCLIGFIFFAFFAVVVAVCPSRTFLCVSALVSSHNKKNVYNGLAINRPGGPQKLLCNS